MSAEATLTDIGREAFAVAIGGAVPHYWAGISRYELMECAAEYVTCDAPGAYSARYVGQIS